MKKLFVSILVLGIATVFMGSCKKEFDNYIKDPNQAESVPPNLLLRGILYDMYTAPFGQDERWNQFTCCNYNYYGNNQYNWTTGNWDYSILENIQRMETEAIKAGSKPLNPYEALGNFLTAYFYIDMTLQVGDLPMSQALEGQKNFSPKYDSQKDIYLQCFKWLDSANNELQELINQDDQSLSGDFYYSNNLSGWQKAVNTFRLRVLISLSKRASDAALNVPGQFQMILNNPTKYPIFQSMADNLQFTYDNTFDKYPNNPDVFGFQQLRYNMAATYLNNLAALHDPRVFVVAGPARQLAADSGYALTDFRAFVGANSGQDQGDMYHLTQTGYYSLINRKRYYSTYTAEPTFILSYPEMCFNIAEAINRGWVSGDAEQWYILGIKAMFSFYGLQEGANTVYFLKPGGSITNPGDYDKYTITFDFNTYYSQPSVKYAGNNQQGLAQILLQKYFSFFRNSGLEAYYNFRRTGVPAFLTGPNTGNGGNIPIRFVYPTSEINTNNTNYQAAIQSQFGGTDNVNDTLWILK